MKHDIVMAVKEMLERHWNVYEIATKLKIDISVVQTIINLLS
jgi:predicted transcriptional regulator